MENLLKEHFDRMASCNMIGHAFLIGNTNFNNLKENLKEILCDYFFNDNFVFDNNNDVFIIKPENEKIVKNNILELQNAFKTFSQTNKNRIYIIDEAEKMNDYASNSLLKFLEEPAENIYAFLITNNINKVIPTIKSRCQVLMVSNSNTFSLSDYDDIFIEKCLNFLNIIEDRKEDAISDEIDFFNKKEEKNTILNLLLVLKYFYRDVLNFLLFNDIKYFKQYDSYINKISLKNDKNSITNKLILLNQMENMLQYNLNTNLFLDKLIIDLARCNDE